MRKVIDLTHDISHHMQVFPGDPPVSVLTPHTYESGYMVSQVVFGTHTGTHVDAPVHKIKGTKAIDEISINTFMGRAFVMDATFLKPRDVLIRDNLDKFKDKVKDVSAVILKTGWSKYFGHDDYFSKFPGISEEAAPWFYENGITLLGLETPSVHAIKHEKIHLLLLEKEVVIVESLANVEEITGEYVDFFAVPLKLKGLDGSPVRAYAIEE